MSSDKPDQKNKRYFITGTDTDAGKTFITCTLIEHLQHLGHSVMAIKPIAAGSEKVEGQWVNDDALLMKQTLIQQLEYSAINPIALESAIAPHLAAKEQQLNYSVSDLSALCKLEQWDAEYLLVEGAGGWLVPINESETLADFAVAEQLNVILVVGMKLGCINHALLTVESIRASGLELSGWIANSALPNMNKLDENIETLKQRIGAPLLAIIPYIDSTNPLQTASSYVNIEALL